MPRAICASASPGRRSDQSGHHRQRPLGPGRRGFGGKFKHRPVEPDLADRELRGVDADRQPAGAGVDVIARQCALMRGVERAVSMSASGCAGITVPWAIRRRTRVEFAMVHGVSLSKFRAGDGKRRLQRPRRLCGRSACLERPFDGPAGAGEVFHQFLPVVHDIDQDRAGPGLRRLFRPTPWRSRHHPANSGPICFAVRPSRTRAIRAAMRESAVSRGVH